MFGWLILGFLIPGVFLGLGRHGAIWEDARALFLPAGVFLMIQSLLLGGRRGHPYVAIPPNRLLAPGIFICGLGLAGWGLKQLDPDRPWTVAMVPMFTLLGLLFLREAIRGDKSVFRKTHMANDRWYWLVARAGFWMFGLFWPVGVLWALGVDV